MRSAYLVAAAAELERNEESAVTLATLGPAGCPAEQVSRGVGYATRAACSNLTAPVRFARVRFPLQGAPQVLSYLVRLLSTQCLFVRLLDSARRRVIQVTRDPPDL